MAHLIRNKWPLYLVTESDIDICLPPLALSRIVLISASFAFARLFCGHLEVSLGKSFDILRVTYYNRVLPVRAQSSAFVAQLDRLWCKPPSVIEVSYCLLCVKYGKTVEGLTVVTEHGKSCQAHQRVWSPQYQHEQIQLNELTMLWNREFSAGPSAALRCAKVAWTGPLYFLRAMKSSLPADILDYIVTYTTYCEQL